VDGIHIIHLGKTWEKIQVAARVFDIFKLFVVFLDKAATDEVNIL